MEKGAQGNVFDQKLLSLRFPGRSVTEFKRFKNQISTGCKRTIFISLKISITDGRIVENIFTALRTPGGGLNPIGLSPPRIGVGGDVPSGDYGARPEYVKRILKNHSG